MTMHTLSLRKLHIIFLSQALASEGWATSAQQLIAASNVLDTELFQDKTPVPPGPEAADEFLITPVSLAVTERQRDALKACLRFIIGKGQVRPNKYLPQLLDAVGLSD